MTKTTTTSTVYEYDAEGRKIKETTTVTESDTNTYPFKHPWQTMPCTNEVKDFEVWNLNKPHTYSGSLSEGGYTDCAVSEGGYL